MRVINKLSKCVTGGAGLRSRRLHYIHGNYKQEARSTKINLIIENSRWITRYCVNQVINEFIHEYTVVYTKSIKTF